MKSLIELRPLFRKSRKLSNKYYRFLGQVSFWLLLGFTGNAWSHPAPNDFRESSDRLTIEPAVSTQSRKAVTLTQLAPLPLTRDFRYKFPSDREIFRKISDQSQPLPLAQFVPPQKKTRVERVPTPVILHKPSSMSRSTPKPLQLAQVVSPAQRQCWQVPLAACSYSESGVRFDRLSESSEPGESDPELGVLRVNPILKDEDEFGSLRGEDQPIEPNNGAPDPELGTLRVQERPPAQTPDPLPTPLPTPLPKPPRQASVFLLARVDYFKTSNVFSARDPVDDGLIRSGLTLFYAPPLGPRTFLITSIDANLIRYANLGSRGLNYDEVRYRAGIYQRLTPRLSGEIGWSNQKLYTSNIGLRQIFGGDRFFNDNSLRLELSRQDPLSPRVTLNTFYQFRWSIADPSDRSRLLNSLIATVSYSFSQKMQTALDYQFTWSHFTEQSRDDLYHQVVARFTYNLTPRNQINVFSGFSFGNSSDQAINFNSFIFGVGIVVNMPLF